MSSIWIVGATGDAFGVVSGDEVEPTGREGSGEHEGRLTAADATAVEDEGWRSADRNGHIGRDWEVLFLAEELETEAEAEPVPLMPLLLVVLLESVTSSDKSKRR